MFDQLTILNFGLIILLRWHGRVMKLGLIILHWWHGRVMKLVWCCADESKTRVDKGSRTNQRSESTQKRELEMRRCEPIRGLSAILGSTTKKGFTSTTGQLLRNMNTRSYVRMYLRFYVYR